MRTAYFGWEAGSLQNSNVRVLYGPLTAPVTIVGYQFDLSMQNMGSSLWGAAPTSQVLFQAAITTNAWNGGGASILPVALNQIGGTNPAGLGGGMAQDSVFSAAILKMVPTNFVNKSLRMENLSLAVPAGGYLGMFAGHSGVAVDFEMQGVIFYEG